MTVQEATGVQAAATGVVEFGPKTRSEDAKTEVVKQSVLNEVSIGASGHMYLATGFTAREVYIPAQEESIARAQARVDAATNETENAKLKALQAGLKEKTEAQVKAQSSLTRAELDVNKNQKKLSSLEQEEAAGKKTLSNKTKAFDEKKAALEKASKAKDLSEQAFAKVKGEFAARINEHKILLDAIAEQESILKELRGKKDAVYKEFTSKQAEGTTDAPAAEAAKDALVLGIKQAVEKRDELSAAREKLSDILQSAKKESTELATAKGNAFAAFDRFTVSHDRAQENLTEAAKNAKAAVQARKTCEKELAELREIATTAKTNLEKAEAEVGNANVLLTAHGDNVQSLRDEVEARKALLVKVQEEIDATEKTDAKAKEVLSAQAVA
jgi:chromosome segregation ATPase